MLNIKFILGLIIAIFCSSCAVIAVGAVGAAAGTTVAVATDPRSSGVIIDDKSIETKLSLKYSDNYPNSNIYVTSYDGAVLLTGQIPDTKTRNRAVFEAKSTPGVKKIFNYLEIRLPQSFGSRSEDSWITTQVKSKLIGMKNINSNSIKVVTTNQVVYLFGIVNKNKASEIAEATSKISNVKKVVTLFEYIL